MWFCVDKNGQEVAFHMKPVRWRDEWVCCEEDLHDGYEFKNGTIKGFIGKKLTWDDEPVEIKIKDEDKV